MGGVNNTRDYAKVMGFGHYDEQARLVQIDHPLLQGGIVRTLDSVEPLRPLTDKYRLPSTIFQAASRLLRPAPSGQSLVLLFNVRPKTRSGCSVVSSFSNLIIRLLLTITARVFNGIGTGILNAITPVWATETAEHTSRGQFVSIEFTLNIFGVVGAYWIE